jgi:hypothetical protein
LNGVAEPLGERWQHGRSATRGKRGKGKRESTRNSLPSSAIDYAAVIAFKRRILEQAWSHFLTGVENWRRMITRSATRITIGWKIMRCSEH